MSDVRGNAWLPMDDYDLDRFLHHHAVWSGRRDRAHVSLFELPLSILEDVNCSVENEQAIQSSSSPSSGRGLTCLLCGLQFTTVVSQQAHFKSEAHISKLRSSSHGSKGRSIRMASDEESENSAEDASVGDTSSEDERIEIEDEEETPAEPYADNLLFIPDRGKLTKNFDQKSGPVYRLELLRFPRWSITFSTTLCREDLRSVENPIRLLARSILEYQRNSQWSVLMLRSGRFCGVIYSGDSVLAHKTFRRYTIRAKSGGSQSSHDNQGRKAKSAGAMLRRYGEQSLRDDVRGLLNEWSSQLNDCSLLIISVPKTMRSLVFDETPLRKDDPRVVHVPFMVNKPTLDEASRIRKICSSIMFNRVVSEVDSGEKEISLSPAEGKGNIPAEPAHNEKASTVHKLEYFSDNDGTEETVRNICESAKYGDVEKLRELVDDFDDDSRVFLINAVDGLEDMRTPLHLASEAGHSEVVAQLLSWGANPCRVDVRSRLPYFMCKTKAVRDVYRKARATSDLEHLWDWDSAGVPPPLSKEVEMQKKEKEKEKKKRAKQRKKEAKEHETKIENDKNDESPVKKDPTPEKSLAAGLCAYCEKSLINIKVLDVFDRRCCSTNCVILLRRKLAGEAALQRMAKQI